jgi:hypothetical protein
MPEAGTSRSKACNRAKKTNNPKNCLYTTRHPFLAIINDVVMASLYIIPYIYVKVNDCGAAKKALLRPLLPDIISTG